jgi:hypothetical protein
VKVIGREMEKEVGQALACAVGSRAAESGETRLNKFIYITIYR